MENYNLYSDLESIPFIHNSAKDMSRENICLWRFAH